MKAYRVWGTFDDDDIDSMVSAAFEDRTRAEKIAEDTNREHQERVGPGAKCRYEVREEEIPRDFDFNGTPSRVVMVILGSDKHPTDVSQRP